MDKEKIKFLYSLFAQIFLIGYFLVVAVSLVRTPCPQKVFYLYVPGVAFSFFFFSIYECLVFTIFASIVGFLTLIINPHWLVSVEIAMLWAVFFLLYFFLKFIEKKQGEFYLTLEKKREEITAKETLLREFFAEKPVIKERFSRYERLADFSLKLAPLLDFEKISAFVLEFTRQCFPACDIHLVSHPDDAYDRWIYEKAEPILVEDINKDYRFPPDRRFFSLIACPVILEGKIFSLIKIFSKERAFQPQDLRFLYSIASLAGLAFTNAFLFEKTQNLAITDSLTGLFNRRYFMERLEEEVTRARRFSEEFVFMMIDLDHFKSFNDRFGHLAGDEVLRRIAGKIKKKIRLTDFAGRYGGEEFAVFFPKTDKKEAGRIAEGLLKAISMEKFKFAGETLSITATIGISFFPEASTTDEIISIADRALYEGKAAGRNCFKKGTYPIKRC